MPNVTIAATCNRIEIDIYPWTLGRGKVTAWKEINSDGEPQPARISVTCGLAPFDEIGTKSQDGPTLANAINAATTMCVTLDAFLTDLDAFETVAIMHVGEWIQESWTTMAWHMSGLKRPTVGSREFYANLTFSRD